MKTTISCWIEGHDVTVEDGCIVRGVKLDQNGSYVASWPYRWSKKQNCWVLDQSMTPAAFRSAVRRGTAKMM